MLQSNSDQPSVKHLRKNIEGTRNSTSVSLASFLLIFIPIALNIRIEGIKFIFRSFAADAFFYLAVAKQASWNPLFSFDGESPTNGFHPLWQWTLKTLGQCLSLDSEGLIYLAFTLSWILVAIATPILVACTSSITKRPLLSLFSFFPGFIYLASSFSNSFYGNAWSFINGMESPASLALFAVFLMTTIKWKIFSINTSSNRNFWKLIACGLFLSLITLARLDDVFLIISFLAVTVLVTPGRFKLPNLLALSAFPLILISSYMALNYFYADSFMPISGIAKAGIGLKFNAENLASLVLPVRYISSGAWGSWGELSWRVILMLLPAFVATGFLWKKRKEIINNSFSNLGFSKTKTFNGVDNATAALTVLSLYIIFKSIYNFLIVSTWHQGHWYYPISIASANLILAYLISDYLPNFKYSKFRFFFALALIFSLNIYISNSIESRKASSKYNMNNYNLWMNRNSLIASISRANPKAKIVSFDDGIVAFSINSPVMNGLGFALDKESSNFAKKGSLLQFALSRGYQYVTSLNYMPGDLTQEKPFWLKDSDSEAISFETFLKHPNLTIYKMNAK